MNEIEIIFIGGPVITAKTILTPDDIRDCQYKWLEVEYQNRKVMINLENVCYMMRKQ